MSDRFDAIIVGSGFGGGMVAHALVNAGWRVLLLERGGWVERGAHSWGPDGAVYQTPHYSQDSGFIVAGRHGRIEPGIQCVGGQSVFYGGVSLRMREADFDGFGPEGAGRWPFGYPILGPWYTRAERLLGVAGENETDDHTAPPRHEPYPIDPPELSAAAERIRDAAAALGLRPFRLPLAVNYTAGAGRDVCARCLTCDAFACAIGAKNDIASAILPALTARGLTVLPDTRVLRLTRRGTRLDSAECVDVRTGERRVFRADQFVLSAGALASPQLVFESGLSALNGGEAIGRHLVRHCSAIVYGVFRRSPNPNGVFHKQIGIHDYCMGHHDADPNGRLGAIQQVHSPPVGLASSRVPGPLRRLVPGMVARTTGLLVLGGDEPRRENRVFPDPSRRDRFGVPRLMVVSRYTRRDLRARRALIVRARRVLRTAGAVGSYTHPIRTFSHAVGTLRMGDDPRDSVLDPTGRFRGVDNLTVADASMLPNTGARNPSLTIAAAALHAADALVARGI
jgi:choline dehydrogenase-like flavoprotein